MVTKTKQGYDLQIDSNTLGPFLFTKLLTPLLVQTAQSSPPGSVKVMWVASSATYLFSPPGGVEIGKLEDGREISPTYMYAESKDGMALLSLHFAKLYATEGILSTVRHLRHVASSSTP